MDLNSKKSKLGMFLIKYRIVLSISLVVTLYISLVPTNYTKAVNAQNKSIKEIEDKLVSNQKAFKEKVDEDSKDEIVKLTAEIDKSNSDKQVLLAERNEVQTKLDDKVKKEAEIAAQKAAAEQAAKIAAEQAAKIAAEQAAKVAAEQTAAEQAAKIAAEQAAKVAAERAAAEIAVEQKALVVVKNVADKTDTITLVKPNLFKNGKEYFLFSCISSEGYEGQFRYCVDINTYELYVYVVDGSFYSYNDYKKQIEDEKKSNPVQVSIDVLTKSVLEYGGQYLELSGTIVFIEENFSFGNMLLSSRNGNLVHVKYLTSTNNIKGDYVTIRGSVIGYTSDYSSNGNKISMPSISAYQVSNSK